MNIDKTRFGRRLTEKPAESSHSVVSWATLIGGWVLIFQVLFRPEIVRSVASAIFPFEEMGMTIRKESDMTYDVLGQLKKHIESLLDLIF